MKLLVLVISGGLEPVFTQLKEQLRLNTHPCVKTVFTEYSPNVNEMTLVDDTLILPGTESFEGITRKTIDAIEYFLSDTSFTHVIRTNLSSFWIFPRLIDYLETREKTELFTGILGDIGINAFVSGAGMIMSRDVAEVLVGNKGKGSVYTYALQDDVAISYGLRDLDFKLTPIKSRLDLLTPYTFDITKNCIPIDVFHIRLKQTEDRSLEPKFMKELIQMFSKNDLETSL
jgi:hypothetical protein